MVLSPRAALIGICGALALPLILSGTGLSAATPPGASAQAVRFRLLDAGGEPLAFARVSLFGTAGSAVADSEGIVTLASPPRPPFRLDVFREDGEWLGAVEVADLPAGRVTDLRLPPVERVEVSVKTGLAPATIAPPAAGATVLSREERERRPAARVAEILEEVPGTSRVGSGHAAVPSVRGLARGRTLILIDDARVTSERRAGPSATYLDPFSLESLEVVRGPGSVVYGSDAIGGIIHGRTPVPRPGESGGRFEAGAGAGQPMASGAIEANLPAGRGGVLLQAHQRTYNEYEAPSGTIPDSGSHDRGFVARWLLPGERSRWVVGLQVDQVRDTGKPRVDTAGAATRYPEEDSARLTLNAVLPAPAGIESLELTLFAGQYGLVTERQASSGPELERSDVDASDASLRLVASLPAGAGALRFGLDASSRYGLSALTRSVPPDPNAPLVEEESIESADRLDAGLFVEGRVPLAGGRLSLAGGIRGQGVWTRNDGGVSGDQSRSSGAATGYAAGTVDLGAGWSATAQVARGFREPTLSDRYFSGVTGRGFVAGNPDLEPETSGQLDLTALWRGERARFAAYGYSYRIEDLIERYRTSPTDFAFRNRGEAEIVGAELEAEWTLPWELSLRFTYGQARGTELDDGEPLADIPPRQVRVTIGQSVRKRVWWRTEYAWQWSDDRPGPEEAEVPEYRLLDVAAGVALGGGIEARIVASNLFDREYPASADDDAVPAPGRGAAVFLAGGW